MNQPGSDALGGPDVELSRRPATGWILLGVAVIPGAWLMWEIERTIGLSDPHLWRLLRDDRVFDLAMLDFVLTAAWASLVLYERSARRDWRFWAIMVLFFVIPSLGIAAFLVFGIGRPGRELRPNTL